MKRRDAVMALAAVLTPQPSRSWAQPRKPARIGFLASFARTSAARWQEAFTRGLREHGWIEGQNIAVEYRYTEGRQDRLPELAADLARLNPDLIVASTMPDTLAARKAAPKTPIVMVVAADPVAGGLAQSLARPGGNITGSSQVAPQLMGKRLELLREIVPGLARIGVLWNPQGPASTLTWSEMQQPAKTLGIQLQSLEVRIAGDLDKVFDEVTKSRPQALVLLPDPVMFANLKRIADFAIKQRIPSEFHLTEFVEAGGLLAYGVNRAELYRRAAAFVDKILKGAKPADLPIEQATKFELAVNLKTARAIGVTFKQELLLRADRVIE